MCASQVVRERELSVCQPASERETVEREDTVCQPASGGEREDTVCTSQLVRERELSVCQPASERETVEREDTVCISQLVRERILCVPASRCSVAVVEHCSFSQLPGPGVQGSRHSPFLQASQSPSNQGDVGKGDQLLCSGCHLL